MTTLITPLSNPLKKLPVIHVAEHVAQVGQRQPVKTIAQHQAGFTPSFGHCATHGTYPLNMQDAEGIIRWYPNRCPTCEKLQQTSKLLEQCHIPKRFVACQFDNFEATTSSQKQVLARCKAYADQFATFHQTGTSLILCGQQGTGKNHLAAAMSHALLKQHYTVLRVKASQYLDAYWAKAFDERESWLMNLSQVDLLILDELGRSSQAKSAQDAFFRLLDARYEAQLPSLLTTNLSRAGLVDVLGEATYDRLTEGGGMRLTLNWDSFRPKKQIAGFHHDH